MSGTLDVVFYRYNSYVYNTWSNKYFILWSIWLSTPPSMRVVNNWVEKGERLLCRYPCKWRKEGEITWVGTTYLPEIYHLLLLVLAAVTKYCRLSDLNNELSFLTSLEAGSPRAWCQHGWVLGECPLPGFFTWWVVRGAKGVGWGRERKLYHVS